MRERVNPETEIVHVPYAQAYEEGFEDLWRRVPDLTRVRKLIGFSPTKTLNEIIDSVAAELREKQHRIDEL